jgi:hypothetical protein
MSKGTRVVRFVHEDEAIAFVGLVVVVVVRFLLLLLFFFFFLFLFLEVLQKSGKIVIESFTCRVTR